ncbi:hypothetical protein J31TS4_01800 [Paenibacillus sp. J31TS4]|uniref:mismatch-specific DNA-glycosylase n=1 Tax=Paenibacillus sp. J31TS4 TaxID=2807195 RepID=UPI001B2E32F7|nr:mismatch-specific DNA-glycosylase [Paenibacillus sp. J31TS4]GIP36900.1 hypothetical protein J31TS4_01800 [Paenibacillus sp. J31TS4]
MGPIDDHLKQGLEILFIGYNPSLRSGEVGHHYANPHNRFYRVLYAAGLTPRLYAPEEDASLLELGYGFTNIVVRPTRTAEELTKEDYQTGRVLLKEKLEIYRPRIACFVGKGVYQQYSGRSKLPWGRQREPLTPDVLEFVAPSTSGLVRMSFEEMTAIFAQLNEWRGRGREVEQS